MATAKETVPKEEVTSQTAKIQWQNGKPEFRILSPMYVCSVQLLT